MLAREELRPRVMHRRMLEQQQRVADAAGLARGDDTGLDGEGFRKWHAPELEEMDVHLLLDEWILPTKTRKPCESSVVGLKFSAVFNGYCGDLSIGN